MSSQGITVSMRGKEEAHDYRYFPDPDLVPIRIEESWVEEIRKSLPELPDEKKERFVRDYGIPEYDAEILTSTKAMANYYEECVESLSRAQDREQLDDGRSSQGVEAG